MITGDVGHTDSRECQGWTEDEGDTVVLLFVLLVLLVLVQTDVSFLIGSSNPLLLCTH